MIIRETMGKRSDSSGVVFRMTELLHQLATTDDAELVAIIETEVEEMGEHFRDHAEEALDIANDLDVRSVAIKAEIERLTELLRTSQSRADRMRNMVKTWMSTTGLTEVITSLYTCKLRNNPVKVDIVDEIIIDKAYKVEKIEYRIDKKAIAEALKAGIPVDGARLLQTTRLEVK